MDIKKIMEEYQDSPRYVSNEELKFMSEYIQNHTEECPAILYRGKMTDKNTAYEIGQEIKFNHDFLSFTEDTDTAEKFASTITNGIGVIFELDESEGCPLYAITQNDYETEWLIPTKNYRITGIQPYEYNEEINIITIESL